MSQELHEECGVFGVAAGPDTDVTQAAYYALFALQHRGQASCGIAVNDRGVITAHKAPGLVNDVFTREALLALGCGQMAVGHVRYGDSGADDRFNAQPLVIKHMKGCMAVALNGRLTNGAALRAELELAGSIFHTTSDAEVISYIITRERLTAPSVEAAVERAMARLRGAYTLVLMSPSKLIAVRDPHGFHPLCIGRCGDSLAVASETCALATLGYGFVRDVRPGEIVVIDKNGMRSIDTHCGKAEPALCVFEWIYFARPDSVVDGCSVHAARRRAGALLSQEHPVSADVVIGVPDSGIDAAIGYAQQSGIPYGLGFIKNKYIGRTFIQPGQEQREELVRIKLSPIADTVRGKRVVLIDDSIVRGTTSAYIVGLLRDAGATEVHLRSSAPKFLHPCYFGTDVDSCDKLIACRYSDAEMTKKLGVDSLGFLSVENVTRLSDDPAHTHFCTGCFSGQYPCEPPEADAGSKYWKKMTEAEENA